MAHTPPGSQQTPGTCMRQLGATTCSHNRGAMPAHNHIDRQTDQHNIGRVTSAHHTIRVLTQPVITQIHRIKCHYPDQQSNESSSSPTTAPTEHSCHETVRTYLLTTDATLVTVQDAETNTATEYSSKIRTTRNPAHNVHTRVPAG